MKPPSTPPLPRKPRLRALSRMAGFTLVEAIMVMVITGIIAGMVSVFITRPIQGYVDSVRRANLTDAADTALRRIARDVRAALPNSLRQPGSDAQCIEFLPVVAAGRYRLDGSDPLLFSATDSSFAVYGYTPDHAAAPDPATGQSLVIYNLGLTGADAYADTSSSGSTRALVAAGSSKSTINITAKRFPFESPGRRFHLLAVSGGSSYSVVYACIGTGAGATGPGTLYRYTRALPAAGLAALGTCPTSAPGGATVLAENVAACSFDYIPAVNQRNGQLSMALELREAEESVRLYHEVHVNNVP